MKQIEVKKRLLENAIQLLESLSNNSSVAVISDNRELELFDDPLITVTPTERQLGTSKKALLHAPLAIKKETVLQCARFEALKLSVPNRFLFGLEIAPQLHENHEYIIDRFIVVNHSDKSADRFIQSSHCLAPSAISFASNEKFSVCLQCDFELSGIFDEITVLIVAELFDQTSRAKTFHTFGPFSFSTTDDTPFDLMKYNHCISLPLSSLFPSFNFSHFSTVFVFFCAFSSTGY